MTCVYVDSGRVGHGDEDEDEALLLSNVGVSVAVSILYWDSASASMLAWCII